ncbi:MAG: hypothetical protein NTX03_00875 [Bacteroidetes bacterium]|nr:hypothetical protein [Bacteroidota bacterium]
MKTKLYLLILALFSALPLFAQEEDGEKEQETARKKFEEFHNAWRDNNLNAVDMYKELQQTNVHSKSLNKKGSTTWQYLGPMNQSGRMMGVVVTKTNTKIWYAVADGGGIWRTTDGGVFWAPITDTFPSLRMSTIGISNVTDKIIVAGTHEGFLYITKDSALSWKIITPCKSCSYVNAISFHPTEAGRFLVAMEGGLYETRDTGKTWAQLMGTGRFYSAFYDYSNTDDIFAAANYGTSYYGLLVKLKKKTSTTYTPSQLLKVKTSYWGTIKIDQCATKPGVLYALLADSQAVIKSADTGKTWVACATKPYRDSYHKGMDYLAVSPDNSNTVFTGTTWMFRTLDGGKTWETGDTIINNGVHVDVHCLYFPKHIKNKFFGCNDGGIYSTSAYRGNPLKWTYHGNNIQTLQIYNCALHPQTDDTVIVGTQDNGYDKYHGADDAWKVVGGDGFCTIYDYDDPAYFYHEYCSGNLHRASNGFTWWSAKKMNGLPTTKGFYDGVTTPDKVDWYGQGITISPKEANVLYFGTNFLYKTTDKADNWDKIDTNALSTNTNDFVTKIAVAPSDSSIVYVGMTYGNMYRIKDSSGVVKKKNISKGLTSYNRWRGIAISDSSANTVFICGDGGWANKGIYRTLDGGKTWKVFATGLPKAAVNVIMFDKIDEKILFAGTTYGLFYSKNRGVLWEKMPNFPNVEVWDIDIKIRNGKRSILVGTYGRGAIYSNDFDTGGTITSIAEINKNIELKITSTLLSESSKILLNLPQETHVKIKLLDANGKLILTLHNGIILGGNATFPISSALLAQLSAGVYLITAETTNATATIKCIKQ